MNAHAMVAAFTPNFNTAAMANQINQNNFAQLPRQAGEICLNGNQALYLYGGRSSLVTALNNLLGNNNRIIADRWNNLAIFRARRTVANGVKTKQLIVLTTMQNGVPAALQPLLVQEYNGGYIRSSDLQQLINNLAK